MHHRLDHDLPERTGFGGLWGAMEVPRDEAPTAVAAPRQIVATSAGASSAKVRSRLAAFLAATAAVGDAAA